MLSLRKKVRIFKRDLRQTARVIVGLVWRRLMFRTTVIAISGSVGKTTAKNCIAAVLATQGPTVKTENNRNDQFGVPKTLMSIRPWHKYAVVEVGIAGPGQMQRLARWIKPDVAVLLAVARTHSNNMPTLEDVAREKKQLALAVGRRGRVLLNAEDPHVRAMAEECIAPVTFFGTDESSAYQATDVQSAWPERFSFNFESPQGTTQVRTQLVGVHWLNSVLAALAVGSELGAPTNQAVQAVSYVQPFFGRMQPVTLPNGATLIRDECTGAPDTLAAMLTTFESAQATRKILIWSDVSDSKEKPKKRQAAVGAFAARHADIAVFASGWGHYAERRAIRDGMDPEACQANDDLQDVAEYLREILQPGDLVFLKGRTTDHLSRILFAQFGDIGCWEERCGIHRVCDSCDKLKPQFDLGQALQTQYIAVERAA